MKVAVASEGNRVSGHFGHCEGFTIYDIINHKVETKDFVKNPGHRPGYLPVFLKELDVQIIIAGGMGQKAIELFNDQDINVFVGCNGLVDQIIDTYIKGKLVSTNSVCTEHLHEGHCND